MNVYQKLNQARLQFQAAGVKMSGQNKFAKYKYYELADIVPKITSICDTLGICNIVSFGTDSATLTVVDVEKVEDSIVFSSPMSTADLKGCHAVQNLGAVETYIRRYLYQTAYEIVESDALNSSHNPDEPKKQPQEALATADQKKTLRELAKHYEGEQFEYLMKASNSDSITEQRAQDIIAQAEAKLDGRTS